MWATGLLAAGAIVYYGWGISGLLPNAGGIVRYDDYPYLGSILRLRATGSTSGMWVMLLLPGVLLALDKSGRHKEAYSLVLVTLAAAVPSFSKELLLLALGAVLLKCRGVTRSVLALLLACILVAGTHLVVQQIGGSGAGSQYLGRNTEARLGKLELVESVYLPIKRAGLRAGWQHPWLGLGPGEFAQHSPSFARPGELPENFGRFDPHSAWTGAFAETGLPGLLALFALVLALFSYRPERLRVFGVLLLLFLVASIFKDVMNFRGLWVVIGLYLAQPVLPVEPVQAG